MFAFTPASALHYNYPPACRAYSYERAAEAAVHQAAYDYAVAHARAEAARQREQERRYLAAVRRRAEVAELVEAIYEQQYPQYHEHTYGHPFFSEAQYRERLELEAARRRAELLRQRQEAERARAAAVARQRAEAERRREAARRAQEHWVALLNSQFGARSPEASTSRPAAPAPAPQPSTSTAKPQTPSVESELKRRLATEPEPDVLEALQHLLRSLEPAPAPPADKKGKARATPAIPFSFAKPEPEEEKAHVDAPAAESTPVEETPQPAEEAPAALDRTLSLDTIKRIESALAALRAAFVFPAELDLGEAGRESDGAPELAFTRRNRPVHAYEHALNGLLERLDAVESFGDAEIRGRRRAVVGLVEGALGEVGRRVEESRERERRRSGVVEAVEVAAAPATEAAAPIEETVVDMPNADNTPANIPAQDVASEAEALSTVPDAETEVVQAPTEEVPAPTTPAPGVDSEESAHPTTDAEPAVVDVDVAPTADAPDHAEQAVLEEPAANAPTPDPVSSPDNDSSPSPDTTSSGPADTTSTPSSPSGTSFLLQPAQNPLPDPAPRATPSSDHEDDAELVSVGDVSEGELKEWESVDADGEL